jgi:hypothetical protein
MNRFVLGVLLLLPVAAQAVDCETLRAQVEAKIRANGVAQPVVRVVDAAAPAAGRLVGNCERGAKKLVYTAPAASASSTSPPPPAASAAAGRRPPVVTECADGRVITEGSCRKQP